jgi:hypothetical protein
MLQKNGGGRRTIPISRRALQMTAIIETLARLDSQAANDPVSQSRKGDSTYYPGA